MEIFTLLMQVVDLPAVLLAIGLTQLIKWILPTPVGEGKFDVSTSIYRWLPLFPLIIATLVVIAKDGVFTPTMKFDDSVVRGLLSGMAASYGYRTAKVMIFSKNSNNGKKPDEPKPEEKKPGEDVANEQNLEMG